MLAVAFVLGVIGCSQPLLGYAHGEDALPPYDPMLLFLPIFGYASDTDAFIRQFYTGTSYFHGSIATLAASP